MGYPEAVALRRLRVSFQKTSTDDRLLYPETGRKDHAAATGSGRTGVSPSALRQTRTGVKSVRLPLDNVLPPLQIGIPYCAIQVNGRFFNALVQFQVLRPAINRFSPFSPERCG